MKLNCPRQDFLQRSKDLMFGNTSLLGISEQYCLELELQSLLLNPRTVVTFTFGKGLMERDEAFMP